MDWEDRSTCVLFGDGAGAVIVSADNGTGDKSDRGILASDLNSDGTLKNILYVDGGVSTQSTGYLRMHGKEVYRHAIEKLATTAQNSMKTAGVSVSEIDWIVPHQANFRISEAVAKRLGVDTEKVYSNIHKYGNTTAASIPIALCEALEQNRISKGDIIILAAFGAGYTWASAAIRW